MVCKIIEGAGFKRLVEYNEQKVKEGVASFVGATNYPVADDKLTVPRKIAVLEQRAALNTETDTNVVHIIISFSSKDKLAPDQKKEILSEYMEAIGFADQPYLAYEHKDNAQDHLHIVTTKIDAEGVRINTFRLGKYKSEPARKMLEEKYGLVRAQDQKKQEQELIAPADLQAVEYGKRETKAEISRVVRSVIEHYKFTSLGEFNAVLSHYNVVADRGGEDSAMFKKGGLIYAVTDKDGNKIGRPIKASSIFGKPTLAELTDKFEKNKSAKQEKHKQQIRKAVDAIFKTAPPDKEAFAKALLEKNIYVVFRETADRRVYGVTYVDNESLRVFNGSDLSHDKRYSAQGILSRIASGDQPNILSNKLLAKKVLAQTDFTPGFEKTFAGWIQKGMLVTAEKTATGTTVYKLGYAFSDRDQYVPADPKISSYLAANGYNPTRSKWILHELDMLLSTVTEIGLISIPLEILTTLIQTMLQPAPGKGPGLDYHWRRRQRTRRGPRH